MTIKRTTIIFAVLLLMTASVYFVKSHTPETNSPMKSPSGRLIATTEISGEDVGPQRRFCVKLLIQDIKSGKNFVMQTGASDYQKWATGWAPGDVLVLYSSDIGTYSYELQSGMISERPSTSEEQKFGKESYQTKYGTR